VSTFSGSVGKERGLENVRPGLSSGLRGDLSLHSGGGKGGGDLVDRPIPDTEKCLDVKEKSTQVLQNRTLPY